MGMQRVHRPAWTEGVGAVFGAVECIVQLCVDVGDVFFQDFFDFFGTVFDLSDQIFQSFFSVIQCCKRPLGSYSSCSSLICASYLF